MADWNNAPQGAQFFGKGMFWIITPSQMMFAATNGCDFVNMMGDHPAYYKDFEQRPAEQQGGKE